MKTRTLLISILAAGAIMLNTALPAHAASYADPFTTNLKGTFNDKAYSLTIEPASSSQVERYAHNVNTTYTSRVTSGGKTIYTGTLGYSRTGYLHTKLTGDITRDYSLSTYIKKVTAFSADYAMARNDALVKNYREARLRADVEKTARNVNGYLANHNNSLTGIENDNTVIAKSDGYYGYNDGDNLEIHLSVNHGDNPTNIYYVTGVEKADLYQSVFDGNSGAFRSGTITTVSNIN